MSIYNRQSFLDNVAKQLGRPTRTKGVVRPEWSVQPQWEVFAEHTEEELINELEKQCQFIHTDFKRTNKENLARTVEETIKYYEGQSLIYAKDERNKEFDLDELFQNVREEDVEVYEWDPTRGEENYQFAERADVGLTFSDITLAESGTVTLLNNKHHARTISLLPQTHIAIIPKETIVRRMTQAVKKLHEMRQEDKLIPSCVSFVTGPSNSADIEMNLMVGVHGPIKATYIVVE